MRKFFNFFKMMNIKTYNSNNFFFSAAGLKGQKVVIANKAGSSTATSTTSTTPSSAIRIVKVGNQPKKTIAIMPAANSPVTNSSPNVSSQESSSSDSSRLELKRKLAEAEESAKRILEEYEQKLAEAKRLREELVQKQDDLNDET